jgi:hypothetical protein
MAGERALNEPRLDQLFAEPIVQQLMHRDGIDEATTRRLLRQAAIARSTPRTEGALALVMVSPLLGHPRCLGYRSMDHKTTSGLTGNDA